MLEARSSCKHERTKRTIPFDDKVCLDCGITSEGVAQRDAYYWAMREAKTANMES